MGFIATDLATIPLSPRYSWYVFLLEDQWSDQLRHQLERNFINLARAVGPNALVIRGAEPEGFYSQVLYEYALQDRMQKGDKVLPALVVTDTPPATLRRDDGAIHEARIMLFPLARMDARPTDLTAFLQALSEAIQAPESLDALERLDRGAIRRRWGWITRYLELKPSFMGFGLDIDAMIDDAVR